MQIKVHKLEDDAKLPFRKNPEDAGLDFFSLFHMILLPGESAICKTGITVEIPAGYCAQMWPKSKNDHLVGAGIIDAGYQGEVLVKIFNPTSKTLVIKPGDGIAQMVLVSIITPEVLEVSSEEIHQKKSARGKTGGIFSQSFKIEV